MKSGLSLLKPCSTNTQNSARDAASFAMFNATPDEQRHCAAEMNRLIEKGLLKPLVGRAFPLSAAADAHRFLEANAVHGAGSLTGKVIIAIE